MIFYVLQEVGDAIVHRFIDFISWGFLLLFFVPTVLIVASWNALPGDSLYGTKLAFESVLLALAKPSLAASGSLSIKYTERRFSEAKQLLADKHSVEGLTYLDKQVGETRALITEAPTGTTQHELAQAYVLTLQGVATQLEQQKLQVLQTSQSVASSNTVGQPSSLSLPTISQNTQGSAGSGAAQVTQTPSAPVTQAPVQLNQPDQSGPQGASQNTTVAQITETQQTISQTIQELQTITQEPPDQGKGRGNNDQKDQNNKGDQGQDNGDNSRKHQDSGN